nr:MAG TPA: hypothetical protein [Caudoviricetes sp.]
MIKILILLWKVNWFRFREDALVPLSLEISKVRLTTLD